MARDWSSLPAHLLGVLFDRLYVLDFIRCRTVCTSWHLAASTENPHGPTGPQIPLLLFAGQGLQFGFQTLFSLAENRCYRLPFPDSRIFRWCVGSLPESGSLIVLKALTHEIYLFNPLTSAEFTITAPVMDYSCLVKVSIFPQSQLISIIDIFCRELSFARFGEKRWTKNIAQYCSDSSYAGRFEDMVFHRNRLYGICQGGKTTSFDIAASPPIAIPLPDCDCRGDDRDEEVSDYYLAESADGTQLLQIWRYKVYSQRLDLGCVIRRTRKFKVFRLDPASSGDNNEWVETKNIGEHSAIFLGLGRSMVISVHDLPELKRNCIYYIDAHHYRPLAQNNAGIFNIGDGSCEPLSRPESFLSSLIYPLPVWFTPRL